MLNSLKNILNGEEDIVARMANTSAFIMQNFENLNWAGFYIVKNGVLKLGPFQGKVAISNIEYGRGVCGAAWKQKETIVVDDVHTFKDHIACDIASNSEIVIPILVNGEVVAVLDIDSPIKNRFDEKDKEILENISDIVYI